MLVSVDRAGRVVIPKELRDRLSIDAGTVLELEVDGDGLRLTPIRHPRRAIRVLDGLPLIEAARGSVTTDAEVQRWRDAQQR